MNAPQKTKRLSTEHVNDVLTIAFEQFGSEFVDKNSLAPYLQDEGKYGFVIEENNKVAGFVIGRVCDKSELRDLVLADQDWFENEFENESVGIIETIAVNPDFSGKGLGQKLVSESLDFMTPEASKVLTMVWEHPDGAPLETILEKKGFEKKRDFISYWKADSLEKGYGCTYCDQPPCTCNAGAFVFSQIG